MAVKIVERNGRKYGYGENTVPAQDAIFEELIDLSLLNARISANKKNRSTKRSRNYNKKKDYTTIIRLAISVVFICFLMWVALQINIGEIIFSVTLVTLFVFTTFTLLQFIRIDSGK